MLTSQIFRDLVLRVLKIRPKSCCKSVQLWVFFKSCGCFWNVICVYVHWINGSLFILQLQASSSLTYCQTSLLYFTKCHFQFPFRERHGFAGCRQLAVGMMTAGKASPAFWDGLSTTWDCSQRGLREMCLRNSWEGCSHNSWYRCKKRKRQQT